MSLKTIILLLFLLTSCYSIAQKDSAKVTFNGQLTTRGIVQFEDPAAFQLGGRFVPTLLGNFNPAPNKKIDFEASMNIVGSANFTESRSDSVSGQFKPYRVWARYSSEHWELRLGLQKINFGSAKIFRPLMWFDRVDVRDPLQLTDGVYGALGRYYFSNNSNIWMWTLIGNKKPKGFETTGSAKWIPELGGRFQLPAGPGELAVSSHYRKVDVHHSNITALESDLLNETRIGLDGKWDLGIGLWFESSVTHLQANPDNIPRFQDSWNLGADYTFGIGNGLGATLEYFRYHVGDEFLVKGTTLNLIGSLFTYPVSILDNISAMVYVVPEPGLVYNYLSWTRTYDNWSFYAIGYWNPESFNLITSTSPGKNLFNGKGFELMVNYNF